MIEAAELDVAEHRRATTRSLRVGIMSRTFFYVPLWEALDRGLFAPLGFEVETAICNSATKATALLLDGGLDIALAPTEGVIRNVEEGGPLQMVAGQSGRLSHFLMAQSRFKQISDLRGAVIGCISPDEGSRFHIEEILGRHGLSYPGDYEIRAVGGAPARWERLQDGSIDAGLQSIPLNYMAEDRGFSNLGAATDYIPNFQFTTVNVRSDWAAEHDDALVSFLAVMLRMTRWMFEDRAGAETVGAREMRVDRSYAVRAWDDFVKYGIMPVDMGISDLGLEKVIGLMKRAGHLPADLQPQPAKYYDLRYLARARQLASS